MADGTTKPIEEIRSGDMVLAADHLDPEGKPKAARVTRFFDNGEKTVVRLVVGEQELVCTPEHPFYVVGKGWVRAEELVEGDLCLNAKGGTVAFISREELAEKRRIYNIEVDGAHTYFVGDDDGVLAHNVCRYCHGAIASHTAHLCVRTESNTVYYRLKDGSSVFLGYLGKITNDKGDFEYVIWKTPEASRSPQGEYIELSYFQYFIENQPSSFKDFLKKIKNLKKGRTNLNEESRSLQLIAFETLKNYYDSSKNNGKNGYNNWKAAKKPKQIAQELLNGERPNGFLKKGLAEQELERIGTKLSQFGSGGEGVVEWPFELTEEVYSEGQFSKGLNELW